MIKRIAITGPESTGKSWLAKNLAQHYNTSWIPEYSRQYLHSLKQPYQLVDIEVIAQEQFYNIRAATIETGKLLISDTEVLVCFIWADFVFGEVPESIHFLMKQQYFDLYLLCDIDLPWEPDPLREHPNHRKQIFNRYLEELIKRKWPFAVVTGHGNERLDHAIQCIETMP